MEIRTETQIAAPVRAVWSILTDFASYPEWNPFIVSVRGEPAAGARLGIVISLPESAREYRFRPRVIACEPERELRWLGHLWMKGLFDGEHFFQLEQRGADSTRFIHGQDISGILLRFSMRAVTRATRGLVYMNQALKRRAESKAL